MKRLISTLILSLLTITLWAEVWDFVVVESTVTHDSNKPNVGDVIVIVPIGTTRSAKELGLEASAHGDYFTTITITATPEEVAFYCIRGCANTKFTDISDPTSLTVTGR